MEGDSQRRSVRRTGIACQALGPTETPMGTLRSREDDRRFCDNWSYWPKRAVTHGIKWPKGR
jgi:hypothetical protein